MGDNREAILEILDKAYQIETDGYTFYSMTAERATKPAVQELFGKLASDEQQHQAFLKSVAARYDEQGSAAFGLNLRMPDARDVTSQVFTGRFREQAAGAQFELAVLSIGMRGEAGGGPGGPGVLRVPDGVGAAALRLAAEHLLDRPVGPHGRGRVLADLRVGGPRAPPRPPISRRSGTPSSSCRPRPAGAPPAGSSGG